MCACVSADSVWLVFLLGACGSLQGVWAARDRAAEATFHWGEAQMTRAVSEKYLGVVMHESCT